MDERTKTYKEFTIKDLPISERPREKLYNYGVSVLSNAELLSIIIRTGHKEDTAIDVAREILSIDDKGIGYLADISLEELMQVKGIGKCKAAQILAAIEIGKRLNRRKIEDKIKVSSPIVLVDLLMDEMRDLKKEHFKIAILDTKNQILSIEEISIGSLNASIVHPREVFNKAIKRSANKIILIHNHPSGDPTPSNEDISVTNRLKEVGNIIGIEVLDHIIIGDNRYISLKEKNLI